MNPSDIAHELRAIADELDAYAVSVAAAPAVAPAATTAEIAAASAAEKAADLEGALTRPDGVTPNGWEGFLRGDNPQSLDDADRALLVASGLLPAPAAPDAGSPPPAEPAAPSSAEPAASGEVGGSAAGTSGGDTTTPAEPAEPTPPPADEPV